MSLKYTVAPLIHEYNVLPSKLECKLIDSLSELIMVGISLLAALQNYTVVLVIL